MAAAVIAMAGVAGFQIISGLQQADMIRAQAGINNEIAEFNAKGAELDAFNALADGMTQEARYQNVIDATEAFQRVSYMANDVDVSFGTARDVIEESKLNGFLNKVDITNVAYARSMGFNREARNIRLQGVMNRGAANLQATVTQNAAIINGITTGVSGYAKYGGGFGGSGGGGGTSISRTPVNSSDGTGYLGVNTNF